MTLNICPKVGKLLENKSNNLLELTFPLITLLMCLQTAWGLLTSAFNSATLNAKCGSKIVQCLFTKSEKRLNYIGLLSLPARIQTVQVIVFQLRHSLHCFLKTFKNINNNFSIVRIDHNCLDTETTFWQPNALTGKPFMF